MTAFHSHLALELARSDVNAVGVLVAVVVVCTRTEVGRSTTVREGVVCPANPAVLALAAVETPLNKTIASP